METLIAFIALAAVVLLGIIIWLLRKVVGMKKQVDELYAEIKTMDSDIKYMKGLELDFSSLEDKNKDAEQMSTEMINTLSEIVEEVNRQKDTIKELEEKVEELERQKDKLEEKEEDEDEDEEK